MKTDEITTEEIKPRDCLVRSNVQLFSLRNILLTKNCIFLVLYRKCQGRIAHAHFLRNFPFLILVVFCVCVPCLGYPFFFILFGFSSFCFVFLFHFILRSYYAACIIPSVIHAFYCRVRWCVTTAIAQEVLHGKVFFFFFHRPLHNHLLALSLLVLSQSIPNIEGRAFPPK